MANTIIYGSGKEDAFTYSVSFDSYTLHARGGDDLISDRSSSDSFIFGDAGDDTIMDYAGNDTLDGGKGRDHFYVEATTNTHDVTVYGGKGDDTLVIEAGADVHEHTKHGVHFYNTANGSVIEVHDVEHIFLI